MGKVLVAGATLKCSHGGQIRISSGNSQLLVEKKAVLTQGMEAGLAFGASDQPPTPDQLAPCPIMTTTPPPKGVPCVTSPLSAGAATKLSVGNVAVLLDGAQGQTINVISPGTWSVADAGQTTLEAK